MIKFYSYWRIQNFCCSRAYKISDNFEIAFQFFQEYAESVRFSLIFKDFGQELKLLPCKNAVPQLCILHARYKSVGVCCAQLWVEEDIRYVNLNVLMLRLIIARKV